MSKTLIQQLNAAGYGHLLLPIIPPDANLSPQSQVGDDQRGKVPGLLNSYGYWTGFPSWQSHENTPAELATWAGWKCNLGLRCKGIVAVDIDVLHPQVAQAIEDKIFTMAGQVPVRTGNPPKRLLVYATDGRPTKRKVKFYLPDDSEHAVELLAEGQQFVAYGIHPKTQQRFTWRKGNDLTSNPLPSLPLLSEGMLEGLWQGILNEIERQGGVITAKASGSTPLSRKPIHHTGFHAPSLEILQEYLQKIPNITKDYEEWVRMCVAIKAAAGGFEEFYPHFEAWCLKYPGNTSEAARKRWDSIHDSTIGWEYIERMAREAGVNTAPAQFTAVNPANTPEEDLLGEDEEAFQIRRMFERHVYVDPLNMFWDTEDCVLRDMAKLSHLHADIGNPFSTKTRAGALYIANMTRRRVASGMTYRPGSPALIREHNKLYINSWRGSLLQMPEMVMDKDLRPWLDLIEHIIPDEEARGHVLDWAAFLVQKPQLKCNWAVLLGSTAQGVGKDLMFQPVIEALGRNNARFIGPGDVASGYTDWAANAKLLIVEEMHSFERKETMNKLKAFIAAPPDTIRVNAKYVPQYDVPNIGAYLFFSNLHNALAVEATDRRFYIYWSPAKPLHADFYTSLIRWYEKGGYGIVARWLMQRDIRSFNAAGRAPDSIHKDEMHRAGLNVLDEWVLTGVEDEAPPFKTDIIALADVAARVPGRVAQAVSTERLMQALKGAGAEFLGRIRLGKDLDTTSTERHRLYAVRRVAMYRDLDNDKLCELFWQQRTQAALNVSDFKQV